MASSIKTCSACKAALPLELFGVASGYRDGRRGQCNPCRTKKQTERLRANPDKRRNSQQIRTNDLRQRYGLSVDDYSRMKAAQGGRCRICDRPSSPLVVDHCHESGHVRGLLCRRCNFALGAVGDNLDGIARFVAYLQHAHAAYVEAKRRLHPGCTI